MRCGAKLEPWPRALSDAAASLTATVAIPTGEGEEIPTIPVHVVSACRSQKGHTGWTDTTNTETGKRNDGISH